MKRKRRRPNADRSVTKLPANSNGLPGWAPYVIFGLLTLFLFREFVVSNGMLFGTDVIALGYFARHFYAEILTAAHTFPLWNPYIFGGLPFVDAMHGDIFYPTSLLLLVMPAHRAMGWKLVLHVFLAGVVTYGWLRHLKISRSIAVFGGITYMLAPVMITLVYPGHDGKLFVTALTPLALWATDWAIARGRAWRFATLAAVVALLMFTAHMQLAYFTVWAIVALAVFRLIQRRRAGESASFVAKRFAALAIAGVIGALAIGAIQVWTPIRYLTKYSQRVERTTAAEAESGYAYSTSWSLHAEETFSLVVPEFVGANLQTDERAINTYWGRNPFKLNHEYAGLIPLLLLPIALMGRKRRGEAWLFAGIAAASLIYALGATTPFFRLFYWLVPGVKLFRAPSSIMFIFAIAVITAAALGLQRLVEIGSEKDAETATKRVVVYTWAAAGVLLLLALLGSAGVLTDLWTATLYRDIDPGKAAALQANLPNIQRGLWLSGLLSAGLALAWQLHSRGKLSRAVFVGAVALLSVLDLLRVDPQYIRVVNPGLYFPRDDTTEFLLDRQRGSEPFRVFPLPNAPYATNHFAFFGLEELVGHHGNELGRYRELTEPERLAAEGFGMFRLLNVRYFVSGAPLQVPLLREVFRGQRSIVYELPSTYPRAMLLSGYEVVPDSLALDRLLSPMFDPTRTAILERPPEAEPSSVEGGRVSWVERGINEHKLEVEGDGPALLLISDNYYPAWRAHVDGNPATVLRANYSLRAISVPAGRHQVSFEYHSPLLRAAAWTSGISVMLVAGLLALSLLRRKPQGEPVQESNS